MPSESVLAGFVKPVTDAPEPTRPLAGYVPAAALEARVAQLEDKLAQFELLAGQLLADLAKALATF
jgi:hypothetical protein